MSAKTLFPVSVPASASNDHHQGDCETCGEWAGDLTEGMCGDCRTRYHLQQEDEPE